MCQARWRKCDGLGTWIGPGSPLKVFWFSDVNPSVQQLKLDASNNEIPKNKTFKIISDFGEISSVSRVSTQIMNTSRYVWNTVFSIECALEHVTQSCWYVSEHVSWFWPAPPSLRVRCAPSRAPSAGSASTAPRSARVGTEACVTTSAACVSAPPATSERGELTPRQRGAHCRHNGGKKI